jgi:hypothetical protein
MGSLAIARQEKVVFSPLNLQPAYLNPKPLHLIEALS